MKFLVRNMMGIRNKNFAMATESACQKYYTRAKVSGRTYPITQEQPPGFCPLFSS